MKDPLPNRLSDENSPYLLQHATNPVDWYPWGPEALQEARMQEKPVFLSVGYAACHWCHVMAHESFEDPDTAAIMNEHFINIKVDREERPDVDTIYMDALVTLTGHGGWPMSVFMTPDGKPFFAGTYFPPTRRYNMPSFQEVLLHIAHEWQHDRGRLIATASSLVEHLTTPSLQPAGEALNPEALDQASDTLLRTYDWANGGWGSAPKFPQPTAIEFLLQRHHRMGDKLALDLATHALDHMARGGMFDLIGGGFHRYSVDAGWLVPHFEKMLYDNALLTQVYLHAWQVTHRPLYLDVFEQTLDFLMREMCAPEGGFYSALDADTEGEEGKYYLWSLEDMRQAISDPGLGQMAIAAFGVTAGGNFEGMNIPYRAMDVEALREREALSSEGVQQHLRSARAQLLDHRGLRVRPAKDDKVLTVWNGMMLTTLAQAARATGRMETLHAAQTLADFLLEQVVVDGALKRAWRRGRARYAAYLEDHAALGLGLLNLYQVDFNPRWYHAALDQAQEILSHFADPRGGFFDTRDDHERLISRPKSIQDSPTPSGNTLAVTLLLNLAALTGEQRYLQPAEATLRSIQGVAPRYPTSFAGWLSALDLILEPQLQLALIGDSQREDFKRLFNVIAPRYLPQLVLAGGSENIEDPPALLHGRGMIEGKATAYLCQAFTCRLPVTSPSQLEQQLEEAHRPSRTDLQT